MDINNLKPIPKYIENQDKKILQTGLRQHKILLIPYPLAKRAY